MRAKKEIYLSSKGSPKYLVANTRILDKENGVKDTS